MSSSNLTFYEFFCGGGMVRAALEPNWSCLFANDFDVNKAQAYSENWGDEELVCEDVAKIRTSQIPGRADLAWASFPCQDLSLAGNALGLEGARSGAFWPFWDLVKDLGTQGRRPRSIVIENVYGAITSHGGKDFRAISKALVDEGYFFGALVVDAKLWVPQSRPRLFIVAIHRDSSISSGLCADFRQTWYPPALLKAYESLDAAVASNWIWWKMPEPPKRNRNFVDIIEDAPTDVTWNSVSATNRIIEMMSKINLKKLDDAVEQSLATGLRMVGGVYKRTRDGKQRAEIRFDGLAGCLRTPTGGSSRQTILVIDGQEIKSRLLSSREAARLMGLPDEYILPIRYNQAYHLCGDGVVVPTVRHIVENIVEPALGSGDLPMEVAAG